MKFQGISPTKLQSTNFLPRTSMPYTPAMAKPAKNPNILEKLKHPGIIGIIAALKENRNPLIIC